MISPGSEDKTKAAVQNIIDRHSHELPVGVRHLAFRIGEDSSGQPAVWIVVLVDHGLQATDRNVAEIDDLAQTIKSEIIESGTMYWPYVQIEEAA